MSARDSDSRLREAICRHAASIFERGLTGGASGNISARTEDGGMLVTPTGASFGRLDPARLSRIDAAGRHVDGDPPTKEMPLHAAFHETRTGAGAVVHLHSTHSVALSMLPDTDPENMLPPLTAYSIMRLGKVRLLPYFRPGDPAMGEAVRALDGRRSAVVLANHGPVVAGRDLDAAVHAIEELEETAKLALMLRGTGAVGLTPRADRRPRLDLCSGVGVMFSANLGFLFTDRPLPEAIRAAGRAGFSAVECHFPYDTPVAEVRAALDETGLPMLGLNTVRGNVTAGDFGLAALPGREAEARAAIDQAIDYARAVGAGSVHVMAGRSGGGAPAEATFRANLAHACDRAGGDLAILIEPINQRDAPGYHLSRVEHAADIIATLGRDNLRIMYDCLPRADRAGRPDPPLRGTSAAGRPCTDRRRSRPGRARQGRGRLSQRDRRDPGGRLHGPDRRRVPPQERLDRGGARLARRLYGNELREERMETLIAIGGYREWDIEPMRTDYDLHVIPTTDELADLPDEVLSRGRVVAFQGHRPFTGAHMDRMPQLGLIANYGVGYDAVDVAAAEARGIRVTNTPDVLSDDVADLAVALLIAQAREMVPAVEWLRAGRWSAEGPPPLARKVSGGRAGIVGLGRIGREIADRLAAFKMEIHYHSRAEKPTPGWTYHADLVGMAREVDFLIVALVGGPATEGYVSAEAIEALGPHGIIVNISRGSTIDERAMIEALEGGRLGGAALDVFRGEPDIDPRFLKLGNVLALPHIASATGETRRAMGRLQRDNIAAFFAGEPLPTPVA